MAKPSPYQEADDPEHDLGPWTGTPSSSRVFAYRYDYANHALQVMWQNRRNSFEEAYVYEGVDYGVYQSFSRAVSKGKRINVLDHIYSYRKITPEEANAPSNPKRKELASRVG